jgi:hypothetical protein
MTCTQHTAYHKPNFRQGAKIAEEFELTTQYAMNARRRYLTDELELLDLEIAFYEDYEGNLESEYLALFSISDLGIKRAKVKMELRSMKNLTVNKPGITDEMIQAARDYPITQLIEFTRGTATAFCHNDRRPSMYHQTRLNRACCPVCDKSFDSIAVLVERDGMTFKSAVHQLQER